MRANQTHQTNESPISQWALAGMFLMIVFGFSAYGLWSAGFYYKAYVLSEVNSGFIPGYNPEHLLQSQEGHPVYVLITHATTASVAFVTGFFQLFPSIRRAIPKLHYVLGSIYAVTMLIAGSTALVLSWTIAWGPLAVSAYSCAAALWLYFIVISLVMLVKGSYRSHGNFMIRTYAILSLFVTARLMIMIFSDVSADLHEGGPDPDFAVFYAFTIWGLLIVHLLVAEAYIARRSGWFEKLVRISPSFPPNMLRAI